MKFVKKPVVVDAICYTGNNDPEVSTFMGPKFPFIKDGKKLGIETLEGTMWASPGDWIIRGIRGGRILSL